MTKRETAKIANSNILGGNKLYLQRARIALPILVRQAKLGSPIYYSDLANEIGMPNARNLNYVLGAIGNAINKIKKINNQKIPPIQCLVINKKDDLPGEGISGFLISKRFAEKTKSERKEIISAYFIDIKLFPHWHELLKILNLQPLNNSLGDDIEKAKLGRGGGESIHHRNFKEYLYQNPEVLKIKKNISAKELEYKLPSQDKIDVLFEYKGLKIGVEAKSFISDKEDILRGVFQCVKYEALLKAEQISKNESVNCRTILALEGLFPREYIPIKNALGIEVIDNITT